MHLELQSLMLGNNNNFKGLFWFEIYLSKAKLYMFTCVKP